MDGPIDWSWKINLLDVCVQASFCQIWSHINWYFMEKFTLYGIMQLLSKCKYFLSNKLSDTS